MKRYIILLTATLGLGTLQAKPPRTTDAPDSVYLFSYSQPDGTGGLQLAWSREGKQWMSVGQGYHYVKSDFGPWGSYKKMYRPKLWQNQVTRRWHCLWQASPTGDVMAHAASDDLTHWGFQSYFHPADSAQYIPQQANPLQQARIQLNGQEAEGWVQRVPYRLIENLDHYADHRAYIQLQKDERAEQDPIRFAGLKPLKASVTVQPDQAKPISKELIGIFFEDINYAADGGLYAELLQNRDFEYSPTDRKEWNGTTAWELKGEGTLSVGDLQPLHANNPHHALLNVPSGGQSILLNHGYDGIPLKQGEKYDFSLFGRIPEGQGGTILVRLLDEQGGIVAESKVSLIGSKWTQKRTVLTAQKAVKAASLALIPQKAGQYALDMVSLFPQKTFKGRKNGLRVDLAQSLANLHPRFVRFPGGCVAHGNGIDNMYDWKGSIGPLQARKPLRNIWGYHQTRGLGYHEYFLFCEDIGAEPVPILAAGVPCQNSGNCNHDSHGDELLCKGQQGGIPLEKMPAYIQDVLDLIEYANGDARTTEWGRRRAEAGHPKPFNLKYIGIGNEDLITDIFAERFQMIFDAVRQHYPEVTVIGTVGPFWEGTDYEEGWQLATRLGVPIVDEHYYETPGWFIHHQEYYDRYDRSKPRVYLGEYAAHLPDRSSCIETALAEALYLTAVERNADVVSMTSYAPLLAKKGHTQWRPDLIYFDNHSVQPTVDYYVQQLYGQHAGTHYLPSTLKVETSRSDVRRRIGLSVTRDEATGDYLLKMVNMLPVEVEMKIDLSSLGGLETQATCTVLSGQPADSQAIPVSNSIETEQLQNGYRQPAYSFSVIRLKSVGEK